ncbi:MAG: cysteine desulfurase family protein [Phycisphaeraceae bacterium]
MDWIYLDNNATTQPAPEVIAACREALEQYWANPSSVHRLGQQVRQRVELARQSVAQLLGCEPRELIFTSGGTEANNLAIRGLLDASLWKARDGGAAGALVTTAVEHSAVREPAEAWAQAGGLVEQIPVDEAGVVQVEALPAILARCMEQSRPIVVSVQWANNETGVIQPIERIAQAVHEVRARAKEAGARPQLYLHTDATQAVGKIPVDAKAAGVDLLTLAAHKFHGPKGVGALYARSGVRLRVQQRGGPQEREKRGGTENTPGILGFGAAAELARDFVTDTARIAELAALRDRFEQAILDAVPHAMVNGGTADRLWNTSNIAFPALEAEAILLGLSERGVCASAGAACSSGSLEPSPVLQAMGVPEPAAHGSVRFSLSRYTTADQIDRAIRTVPEVVVKLGKTMPLGV